MATDLSFVEYVADQSGLTNRLSHKRMFGEYAFYLAGKIVALACDNTLFVKPAAATAILTSALPRRAPYPGAKPYLVADELLDDPELLSELLLATEEALPQPAPKRPKKHRQR